MSCGNLYISIKKHESGRETRALVPARCKSWDCPTCRKYKAYLIKMKVMQFFERKTVYMLTLTFKQKEPPYVVWSKIGKAWNRLLSSTRARHGMFNYIRIVEPHRNSPYPHIHILLDRWVFDAQFWASITRAGFGWRADVRRADNRGAGNYISKYLSKAVPNAEAERLRRLSGTRLVSLSRSLGPIYTRKTGWEILSKAYGKCTLLYSIVQFVNSQRKRGVNIGYGGDASSLYTTYSEQSPPTSEVVEYRYSLQTLPNGWAKVLNICTVSQICASF